jgi:hypothetical protein
MADPGLSLSQGGIKGGTGAAGRTASSEVVNTLPLLDPSADVAYQRELSQGAPRGAELTARAVVSPDGRSIKYTVSPVFQTAAREEGAAVNIPLIPGAIP